MTPKKVSVILSTYNRPKALYVVLSSLCRQENDNFEIIVADDGSGPQTLDVVRQFQERFPTITIHHVWQEKKGFRLARIRNLSVKAATGDYLIFLDGDCIPPPHFISRHCSLAEKGWAVYGQRILATQDYTEAVEMNPQIVLTTDYWKIKNFFMLFIHRQINRLFPFIPIIGNKWRKLKPHDWQKIRGCNWAIWRKDYLEINGSDESFEGWGSEDKDLAVRLINNNTKMKDGRNYSFVLHLWHTQASRDRNNIQSKIVLDRFHSKQILPHKGMIQ